jgi:hypothetical protein
MDGPVSWNEISEVRYVSAARGEPFITLELASEMAHRRPRPVYQFRTGELDIGNDKALALVKEYWHETTRKSRDAEV